MPPATDLVEVLSRRHNILRTLRSSPMERHVLVDHVSDSKSTVYKGVTQLRELGLLVSTDAGLQPTLFGLVALERYDELANTAELGDLLQSLSRDAVPPRALLGAEAVTPDPTAVDRHLNRLGSLIEDAERIRGFTPALSPRYVSTLRERIVTDGVPAELILTDDVLGHLRDAYPDVVETVLGVERVSIYRSDGALPFTLLLVARADTESFCLELAEEEVAAGLVLNDTEAGVAWAEHRYEEEKTAAEKIV